jgi:hypothetical protein
MAILEDQTQRNAIERRAYELYLQHGATHGNDLDDWLVAIDDAVDVLPTPSQAKDRTMTSWPCGWILDRTGAGTSFRRGPRG